MKPRPDHATLIDLAARLERANASARQDESSRLEPRMTAADRDARVERPSAAVARLPQPRTGGHAAACLGAGAVILGLLCLILLGQATL